MTRSSGAIPKLQGGLAARQIGIKIENVTCHLRAPNFDVYLNVPPGERAMRHPELYAGAMGMFGLSEASQEDGRQAASGMNFLPREKQPRRDAAPLFLDPSEVAERGAVRAGLGGAAGQSVATCGALAASPDDHFAGVAALDVDGGGHDAAIVRRDNSLDGGKQFVATAAPGDCGFPVWIRRRLDGSRAGGGGTAAVFLGAYARRSGSAVSVCRLMAAYVDLSKERGGVSPDGSPGSAWMESRPGLRAIWRRDWSGLAVGLLETRFFPRRGRAALFVTLALAGYYAGLAAYTGLKRL